jgi:hypothetical protein
MNMIWIHHNVLVTFATRPQFSLGMGCLQCLEATQKNWVYHSTNGGGKNASIKSSFFFLGDQTMSITCLNPQKNY